jgi:phenylacetate-coenzyme A ligase PaaK-like adenylate-forming protein
MADLAAAGTPAMLNAPASSAVRVARAASAAGWDLSGTLVRTGGEPLTEAKAAAISATGARVVCNYAMTEAGRMGVGCAAPQATDDVHLLTDKVGVIQRQHEVANTGSSVPALLVSSLHTTARKVMINVEIGDYGVLERRDCGCRCGDLGLTLHLHGIRSFDKLTSEGMHFLGTDLVSLVEEALPRRFGGGVGDYQIVESEVDGLPSISVVVRPEVGEVDEDALVRLVLERLRSGASYKRMMTTFLEDGRTVGVVRRQPHVTPAAKVPPLHIVRS